MKINVSDYECEYGKVVSNPSVEENGRSFTLDNQSKFVVRKWSIEKIFGNRNEQRCDYLLLIETINKNVYYWIELKGEDVNEGCKQILSAINNVNVEKSAVQQARIISTKVYVPNLRTKHYFKLEDVVRKTGGKIIVRTNHYSERI